MSRLNPKQRCHQALNLQSVERTLEDADIAGSVDAIVASISEKFGAALRD